MHDASPKTAYELLKLFEEAQRRLAERLENIERDQTLTPEQKLQKMNEAIDEDEKATQSFR